MENQIKEKQIKIKVTEAQEMLEILGGLDEETRKLGLATLRGMSLVSELENSKKKGKTA